MAKLTHAHKYILRNLSLFPETGINRSLFKEWTGLETLNNVNALIERGLVAFDSDKNTLSLQQSIADVCLKNLKPNGKNCKKLLSVLACDLEDINTCLLHENIDDIENLYLSVALKLQGDSKEITVLRTKTINFFSGKMYAEQTKAIYRVWESTCRELHGEISEKLAHIYTVRGYNYEDVEYLIKALEIYDKLELSDEYEAEKMYICSKIAFQTENNDVSLYNKAMENINKFIDSDTQIYGVKAAYTYCAIGDLFPKTESHEKLLIKAMNSCNNIKSNNSVHVFVHYVPTPIS